VPDVDHHVAAPVAEYGSVQPEKLSRPPPGPVANHRTADPARRRDAEAVLARVVGQGKDNEVTADGLVAVCIDTLEVRATQRRWQSASATVTA
jgi:hypothetical protein